MAKSYISPEIKAAALADLAAGEQPAIVAERHGLDRETVKSWKRRHFVAPDDAPIAPSVAPIVRPRIEAQQRQIGELVLDLLRSKLEASQAIAEQARDPAWRARQSAAELATFGAWLDSTAFAIGDRLAGGTGHAEQRDDSADS